MRTLSNNIRVPEDDDAGNIWSDAIEYDLEALNDLITTVGDLTIDDISRNTTTLVKENWTTDPDGKGYKQTVSMPSGLTFLNSQVAVMIGSGENIYTPIHPTINPLGINSYEIIVNDSTLDLVILYV